MCTGLKITVSVSGIFQKNDCASMSISTRSRLSLDDGADRHAAEHVARLLAPDVDLMVLDVLRSSVERAPIDADDPRVAMKPPSEPSTESTDDAGDGDGRLLGRRKGRARRGPSGG